MNFAPLCTILLAKQWACVYNGSKLCWNETEDGIVEKLKVMSVFGTRPEAVKMAPLVQALDREEQIDSIVCVTAQHRQMLDQVLEYFAITPQYDLDIMKDRQTLTGITARVLEGMEDVLAKAKPDVVLVHGDTTTSFVAALAAFYAGIPVGHVEAGLRTYNKKEPFPEEMNRMLSGALSDLHFSPTTLAKEHLQKENVSDEGIYITGNTAIDVIGLTYREDYTFAIPALNEIDYKGKKIIAMTAHRRENLGAPLESVCRAVKRIVEDNEDTVVVYAVHLNPVVQETVRSILGGVDRVVLTEPMSLPDMHNLMMRSYMLMSDSGGLQEEAPSMNKPVIVLRNVTERPEGVTTGALKLAGTDEDVIYNMACELLRDEKVYASMAAAPNPFGDGRASERIVQALLHKFGRVNERPAEYGV